MKRLGWVVAVSTLILTACGMRTVYYHYEHTELAGWEKLDTLVFNVPKAQETSDYGMSLGLRVTGQYPFQRLTLIVERTVYPSHKSVADTISCRLVTRDGRMLGHGVNAYQYTFPVADFSVQEGDSLHITVRHDMKREILPGISDVGIKLTKH